MAKATDKRYLFRGRDALIIFIVSLAFYLTFDTSGFQYKLNPAWYKSTKDLMNTGKFAEYLIPPVICDLDGDGLNEMVVITKNMELQVLMTDRSNAALVFHPEVLAVRKLSDVNIQNGKVPVALSIGYVEPYHYLRERSQVIMVVSDDLTVSCFDHLLTILWEKRVAHFTVDIEKTLINHELNEITILPSPLQVRNSTSGTIFLAFSMRPRSSDSINRVKIEQGLTLDESISDVSDADSRSKLEHLNIFALDSTNGHVLWRHNGQEIRIEQYTKSLPKSSLFRLELRDIMIKSHHGAGLGDWTLFRESLTNVLPHTWYGSKDTFLDIAMFSRKHIGSQDTTTKTSESYQSKYESKHGRFTGVKYDQVPENAKLPHVSSEHISHPNVLVAHMSKGIEVVSLSTGTAITSLALGPEKTVADIDGDSVVDTIIFLESASKATSHGSTFADAGKEFEHCSFVVVSGLPAKAQLFNGSVCLGKNILSEPLSRRNELSRGLVSAASPVIMRKIDEKTNSPSKIRDIIFAVNTGDVACYNGKGEFVWHIDNGPTWNVNFKATSILFDVDAKRVQDTGTHDSYGVDILVVGQDTMSIFSKDGDVRASVEIPSPPVLKPILADFDNDGVTDIVIISNDAVMGYRLQVIESSNGLLIAICIMVVLAILIFVANIHIDNTSARSNDRVFSIARSTDLHYD